MINNSHRDHPPDQIDFACEGCKNRAQEIVEFFKFLEIPLDSSGTVIIVEGYALFDLLNDETKLNQLVSKLKCKAFW